MSRQAQQAGTTGAVTAIRQVRLAGSTRWQTWDTKTQGRVPAGAQQRWRASVRARLADGVTKQVQRYGTTQRDAVAAAEQAADELIHPRYLVETATVTADTSLKKAGEAWLERCRERNRLDKGKRGYLSDESLKQYVSIWERLVATSTLAPLSIDAVNHRHALGAFLNAIASKHGAGTAKTVRSVLSGVLAYAVEEGAAEYNGAKGLPITKEVKRDTVLDYRRAFTPEERKAVVAYAAQDAYAQGNDLSDLVAYLAGTGVRLGEALGQRWEDVDLKAGTVTVRGTKTAASTRRLALPADLVAVLKARAKARGSKGYVFATPFPSLGRQQSKAKEPSEQRRDQRNATRGLRRVLDGAGFPWAHSHTFRRTVGTLLANSNKTGVTQAAKQLGHSTVATTMAFYVDPLSADLAPAAEVLTVSD